MNRVLCGESPSVINELTYLRLRLSILESKTGVSGNHDVSLSTQLLHKKKQRVEELNKQLQEKDEILKEAEGVILQIDNIKNSLVEDFQSKIKQLEYKNAANDKIVKRLEEELESAQQKNGSLAQKVCQLELENMEYKNEISILKDDALKKQLKNEEQKSLKIRQKKTKLEFLKANVEDLRLHFKMCDDNANIKLGNQRKVIDKLNSELNEIKDVQKDLLKIIYDYQSSLKSESKELLKPYQAYDSKSFWQVILRDYKSYDMRLINTPKNIIGHYETQMLYMPHAYMPYKGVPRMIRSVIEANVDYEQRKQNFLKILRAFGRFSVHGIQIGAFIYTKYLNIGRIDDSMRTLSFLTNMTI